MQRDTPSAVELAAELQSRRLTATEITEDCLRRIAEREPQLHAFAIVDPALARAGARALDDGPIRGPLHGVPIGVKDILDTADLPTAYGSPIHRLHRPTADASCVSAARAAGAVIIGKTATTEFACQSPARTVNPRNPRHTPGGSSSGSAAAVADGLLPLAFGTQTAGSIVRPASFCGIVGYKPSFGTLDRSGLRIVADSLDTIGVLTRTVADAALFVGALSGLPCWPLPQIERPRIGICRTADWAAVEPGAAAVVEAAIEALAATGARVSTVELPPPFEALGDAHGCIQAFEAARNLAREHRHHRSELSEALLAMLDAGLAIPEDRYRGSLALAADCRAAFGNVTADCDVLLTASATGEAPLGLASTGDPLMNRVWTLLHGPAVSVPAGDGPTGLPVGVQIVGRIGDDARTLAAASWAEARLSGSLTRPD